MQWLDAFRSHAVPLPNLAKFAIVMAVVAGAPAAGINAGVIFEN